MLPEKKKRLIIALISGVVIVITVFLLGKLSAFIKSGNELRNDDYQNIYTYIGISKDRDGIYKIYGINKEREDYLNIKTFYDIKDILNKENKIVIYSDAVNEIRYNKNKKEFYFYELDRFYSKNSDIKLTKDYLLIKDNNSIKIKKYDNEEYTYIENVTSYIAYDNKIYYISGDLYEYDLFKKETKLIKSFDSSNLVILKIVNNNYLYYVVNNNYYVYDLSNGSSKSLENNNFYSISKDGYLVHKDNTLSNYSLSSNKFTFLYNVDGILNNLIYLYDDTFYLSVDEKYAIIDLKKNVIWKNLDNEYEYIMKVV